MLRIWTLIETYSVWQYGLRSFQTGDTKLERILLKNQYTQMKLLNFEFWINGELSKIGHHFVVKKIKNGLSKNGNNKKCAPELGFFNGKN